MARRKSVIDELFDLLFELTGDFWQVGAVVALALGVGSLVSLKWVAGKVAETEASGVKTIDVLQNFGWALYLGPLVLALLALLFGWKTYVVYTKSNF